MSRVELARINALTFYKGEETTWRRTSALPQLVCVGKPCNLYQPEVVRCKNVGGFGTEVDWKPILCVLEKYIEEYPAAWIGRLKSRRFSRWFPGGHDDHAGPTDLPPYSKDPQPSGPGWRPGFWTGAALGGLGTIYSKAPAELNATPLVRLCGIGNTIGFGLLHHSSLGRDVRRRIQKTVEKVHQI
ncbi:DUF1183-domain-containing protein [Salix suchowensis]|nr:DUF1183-domain-containing protein [Salix suchowensis]